MMTTIGDLPLNLVEKILVRVPINCLGAVRSTCKRWNDLSKEKIVCGAESSQQYLGFMMKEFRVCSVRFDLRGIHSSEEFVDPSIKEIGDHIFNKVEISKVFHCNGLLLSATRDNSSLVVWNPYLGQTKWIQPRKAYTLIDSYKCNIGYAWEESSKLAGASWVLRDCHGTLMMHSRRSYTGIATCFEAKVKSWEWALEGMRSLHVQNVTFSSSAMDLVKALRKPKEWLV